MNTAFGALVRHRRRSLRLTQANLAQRMARQGQEINIAPLEDGVATIPRRDTLDALTDALEWPIGILDAVSGRTTSLSGERVSSSWPIADASTDRNLEQLDQIRADLASLHDLHDVLQQWMDDLDARIQRLIAVVPSQSRAVRYDM